MAQRFHYSEAFGENVCLSAFLGFNNASLECLLFLQLEIISCQQFVPPEPPISTDQTHTDTGQHFNIRGH